MNAKIFFITLIILFPFISFNLHGQFKDTLLFNAKVKQITITAQEIKSNKIVNSVIYNEFYNKDGCQTKMTVSKNKQKESVHLFTYEKSKRETFNYRDETVLESIDIRIIDTINKIHYDLCLSDNRDTLIWNKFYLNRKGQDSIGFVKLNQLDNYKEVIRNTYDKNGKEINEIDIHYGFRRIEFDSINNCKTEYNDNSVIINKECQVKNKKISYFYNNDDKGYNYSINLIERKGGRSVETFDEKGLTQEIIYETKSGKLTAKIVFDYKYY